MTVQGDMTGVESVDPKRTGEGKAINGHHAV
jgi:hypothetical protein